MVPLTNRPVVLLTGVVVVPLTNLPVVLLTGVVDLLTNLPVVLRPIPVVALPICSSDKIAAGSSDNIGGSRSSCSRRSTCSDWRRWSDRAILGSKDIAGSRTIVFDWAIRITINAFKSVETITTKRI